jgi:hypothetical protein
MQTLTTTFALLLVGLRSVIGRLAARDRVRAAWGWEDVSRAMACFELLLADWRAGALPEQQAPAPAESESRTRPARVPASRAAPPRTRGSTPHPCALRPAAPRATCAPRTIFARPAAAKPAPAPLVSARSGPDFFSRPWRAGLSRVHFVPV